MSFIRNQYFSSLLIYLIGLLLLYPCPLIAVDGVPESGKMVFDIRTEGESVGKDTYTFRNSNGHLTVERTATIKLDWYFVNVANYRHDSVGNWSEKSFDKIKSKTKVNETKYRVKAERSGETVVITESTENGEANESLNKSESGKIIPTSWWNPRTVSADYLLDTQYGRFLDVNIEKKGIQETPDVETVNNAALYEISGDLDLSAWYSSDNELVKLKYKQQGYTFVHNRID